MTSCKQLAYCKSVYPGSTRYWANMYAQYWPNVRSDIGPILEVIRLSILAQYWLTIFAQYWTNICQCWDNLAGVMLANVGPILTDNICPISDEYLPRLDQCQTNIMKYCVNIRGISDTATTSDQYRTILTKEWPLYVRESCTTTTAILLLPPSLSHHTCKLSPHYLAKCKKWYL